MVIYDVVYDKKFVDHIQRKLRGRSSMVIRFLEIPRLSRQSIEMVAERRHLKGKPRKISLACMRDQASVTVAVVYD